MQRVATGFRCNNACVFCAQGRLRAEETDATDGSIEGQIAALDASSPVAFVGGEPTLHDDLPRWVALAKRRGVPWVLVQTNGRRLAYASYAAALAEAGVDAVDVSLHGATAAMHDWHTGTPGSFAQTLRGMTHARGAGIAVAASVVVTRSSFRHLAEMARAAHACGASVISFATLALAGRAALADASLAPPDELVRPQRARALRVAAALGMSVVDATDAEHLADRPRVAGLGTVEPHRPPASVRRLPVVSAPADLRAAGA